MFKKSCQLSNQSLVSSKDKKTMMKSNSWCSGLTQFGQLMVSKLSGSKGRVYFIPIEDTWIPAIVDASGKLDIFPTIFYLWIDPTLLPIVETNVGVSSYIMNGADLMWPGVRNVSQAKEIKVGSWVAITTRRNLMPYAVGKFVGYSGEELRGKCVEVYHYYRDKLWESRPETPNIGFTFDEVLPIAMLVPVEVSQPEVIEEEAKQEPSQVLEDVPASIDIQPDHQESIPTPQDIEETKDSQPTPDSVPSEDITDINTDLSTEEADDNLIKIFITALKVGITDDMLPLEPSALIQLLTRCTGRLILDIKKSSYKRVMIT